MEVLIAEIKIEYNKIAYKGGVVYRPEELRIDYSIRMPGGNSVLGQMVIDYTEVIDMAAIKQKAIDDLKKIVNEA